jgi:phage/conjugal plasmid C-4 type zinc finger TraR family protein
MDDVDIANALRDAQLQRLLAARAKALAYPLPSGEAARECDECGDEIPEERRRAMPGCRFCVPCQTARERRVKGKR